MALRPGEIGLGAVDGTAPLHDLLRQPDDPRLLGERVSNGAPDAEARVRLSNY
jgi:hypothetical protein